MKRRYNEAYYRYLFRRYPWDRHWFGEGIYKKNPVKGYKIKTIFQLK